MVKTTMHLAHKIRLYPSKEQEVSFRKACGVARLAFNWAKEINSKLYKEGTKASAYDVVKLWNAHRKENLPFTYEVTKWAGQQGIHNFYEGLKNFFSKRAKYPKFKKKGRSKDSFHIGVDNLKVAGIALRIPNNGVCRMAEAIRFPGRVMSVDISREADQWFGSFLVEVPNTYQYPHKCDNIDSVVGLDLGVGEAIAILSDGTKLENERFYRKAEKKLRRLNKNLSRKKVGSANRLKAKMALAKHHRKIRRKRAHKLHTFTSKLVRENGVIGIETLNVKGMARTKLAKSVHDASMYELTRQLEYKSKLSGTTLVKADRFYPSSKTCSECGFKLEKLELSTRNWVCPGCGEAHDRDINAAKNLRNLAVKYTESLNVCGESVSLGRACAEKQDSVKQECNHKLL